MSDPTERATRRGPGVARAREAMGETRPVTAASRAGRRLESGIERRPG
ncbi:hypothetical protein [Kitasatospora sp. NPDC050463]